MAVSQARLDRYRADVDAYGDAAASYVEQYIAALIAGNPGMAVNELRDEAIEAVEDSLNAFGDQASALALDLFDEITGAYGIEADTAIYDTVPREMIDGGVRFRAIDLADGRVDAFTRDVADLTRYYIHRSAFENMERNCERNDLRYARVPSGRETCGFCFMLSSRGFVYRSEQTAGSSNAYHDNCDCVIVPGFEGLPWSEQVEGYDPDAMYDRWKGCLDTIGGDDALRSEWDAMDAKSKARYKGDTDGERYRRFFQARVIAEVETRDFRWLNTGDIPDVDYSGNPVGEYGRLVVAGDYSPENIVDRGNEWRDLWAHHVLAENGFAVKAFDGKNIDIKINDQWWDVKSPESRGETPKPGRELSFIENDVRKAVRQFDKRGLHDETRIVYNPRYRHDASDEKMISELKRQMEGHGVVEALYITENGGVVRIKIR